MALWSERLFLNFYIKSHVWLSQYKRSNEVLEPPLKFFFERPRVKNIHEKITFLRKIFLDLLKLFDDHYNIEANMV